VKSILLKPVAAGILLIASTVAFGLTAPAFAASTARSDVDSFTFSSFNAIYTLGLDKAGHSIMTVQETLVAQFPAIDQNHGIRRSLVDSYDGHPTDLTVDSVTDDAGNPRDYTEEQSDTGLDVVIAAPDFVHGEQTYVITYTQHDVTRFYADTKADEFYWDTNGTGWAQPFDSVTATVVIDPTLLESLNGNVDASYGAEGATNKATITETDTGYTFEATNLGSYENLTFAIGFEPNTFVARDSGFFASPWPVLSLLGAIGSFATIVWAFIIRRTKLQDAPGRGIVVPEYVAPKGVSIPLAAIVGKYTTKFTAAQIVALAVRGYLRVVETSGFFGGRVYVLQLVSTEPAPSSSRVVGLAAEPLNADEVEFLRALFGNDLVPGTEFHLKRQRSTTGVRITSIVTRVTKESFTNGYRSKISGGWRAAIILSSAAASWAAIGCGTGALNGGYGGATPAFTLLFGIVGFFICAGLINRKRLEPKGVELRDYLLGLKDYINWAEADRLNYLQSPQGAERTPVDASSPDQVLKLYEQLLPYAILFGLDKQWTAELGRYYEQTATQPLWFAGANGFNAMYFSASMSSLGSTTQSTFSSSSGGSGGGSFSGGGGGGGGGGGV